MKKLANLLSLILLGYGSFAVADVTVKEDGGEWRVDIDGALFTQYRHKNLHTPALYPIIGPGEVTMTRHYPIEVLAAGEEKDHPHHVSLWYSHGEVNGYDFWALNGKKPGVIVQDKVLGHQDGADSATLSTANKWIDRETKAVVLEDERHLAFNKHRDGSRSIDFAVTLKATNGDVLFGDTKEGTMAIRTNPQLRLDGEVAHGQAVNSSGDKGKELWGKAANWVDYWGPVDGKMVGVAIFDHPSNPRHPSTWHAREYGLIAVNPFGHSYFMKKEKGAGDMTIKNGESVTFRYRFLFHSGDNTNTEKAYEDYAKTPVK